MRVRYAPRSRRGLAAVALLALAAALAACGGSDDKTPAASPTAAQSAASPNTAASSSDATVSVDESFWHAGWKATLGDAVYDAAEGTVTIDVGFENLSPNVARFDSQLVLTANGENYAADEAEQDYPEVPGGLKGKGAFVFDVDDGFVFDDATLIVGNPTNNQATIPIGPSGDALVSLEPVVVAVTGAAVAGPVTLNVTGVEVRADLPEKSSEVAKGKTSIIVSFSATVGSGIPIGQGVLQSENVALTLPDGTSVAVRGDGVSGVNELLQGKEGTTILGLSVRFEVPSPARGNYVFIVRGNYGAGNTMVSGELPFVIP